MATCIQVHWQAFVSLAVPNAGIVPTRIGLPYIPPSSTFTTTSTHNGATDWTLFKLASASSTHNTIIEDADDNDDSTTAVASTSTSHMGIKIVSVRKDNDQLGLPLVPATIVQLNPQSGIVDAIVAGTFLTAARTAAGSALSAQHVLNNHNNNNNNNNGRICHHLVVFGAGLQAEMHIWALSIALGYSIEYCTIIIVEQLACRVRDDMGWVQNCSVVPLHDTNTVHSVLSTADCIVSATNTIQPLWDDDDNNNNVLSISVSNTTGNISTVRVSKGFLFDRDYKEKLKANTGSITRKKNL
jgi:ornithine cyclodeaminase/alanine dehydrogenase-like protein (mu-crystallin family)